MHHLKQKRTLVFLLLIIAAGLISWLAFKYTLFPFLFVFLCFSLAFLYLAKGTKNSSYKALWFNIGAILFILFLFECVFSVLEYKQYRYLNSFRLEGVYETERDDIVGGRLIPGSSRRAKKYFKDELIYDVVITVNEMGLRTSEPPAVRFDKRDKSIVFFGDSFTFGEGLNDQVTMPYQLGNKLGNKYAIYNFGVHGYGPHQMLSSIEHGRVSRIVGEDIQYVIYQLIYPEHVNRLIGYWSWDEHGPKYVRGKDGEVHFDGHFDDEEPLRHKVYESLLRSALINRLVNFRFSPGAEDRSLFVSVVQKANSLLKLKDPGMQFHIIAWDWTEGTDMQYFDQLRESGIFIHNIDSILPDRNKSNLDYKISPYDKHPNAYGNDIISAYIASEIVKD